MKATAIISKLQSMVNEHGDFDVKVSYSDDDMSYCERLQPDDFDIDMYWDERNNNWHGGWICIDRLFDTEDCDCMYNGMDYNDYAIEKALLNE